MNRKKRSSALFVTNNTNSQNSGNNVSVSNSILNVSEKTSELTADIEGITRMDRLVLVDQKTGVEWELSISDGNISIEPYVLIEKRNFRINKVIENAD
jgi:hypothetical protein